MSIHALNSSENNEHTSDRAKSGVLGKRLSEKMQAMLTRQPIKNLLAQMEVFGNHLRVSRRMKYIPLTVLMLGIASQADAQCCGAQLNLEAGLRATTITNFTDYFSENNGRTRDGIVIEANGSLHQGITMFELGAGTGRLGQTQDANNSYEGDFSHVAGRAMLAGSSDRSFVPYAGVQGGYIHSDVAGKFAGTSYEYSGGRFFWGPVVGAKLNIADVVTFNIGMEWKRFITNPDSFEGIDTGKNPDGQGKGIYPGGVFIGVSYRFAY